MAAAGAWRQPLVNIQFENGVDHEHHPPLFQAQTYRNLLFLVAGIPIAAVVLGLVIAGWTSIAVLAITPLVVPVLLGYRGAVGLVARGDASLARSLLGITAGPPVSSAGRGFWGRAKAVLLDPSFWRQQAYLLLRMTLGFAFAVGELTLIAAAAGALTLPIWYRWSAPEYGSWHADSLGRALLHVPVGIAGLIVAAWLARALGSFSAWQVRSLLAPRPAPVTADQRRRYRRRALWIDGGTALGLVVLTTIIWAATGAGYYWPQWVLLPLALLFAIHVVIELVTPRLRRRDRALAIQGGVVAAIFLFLVRGLGVDLRRVLLARVDAARPGERGRRALADHPQPDARPPRAASRRSRRRASARWKSRTPSSAASSATCTTARRPGWSRSA